MTFPMAAANIHVGERSQLAPRPPGLPDLPEGLRRPPRVLVLIDADAVSHGLVDGTSFERASDQAMHFCLDHVHAAAQALDSGARVRCAASTKTATRHLDVVTTARNNVWTFRRGVDGADQVLLEELSDLIDARILNTRPGRKRQIRLADLVILVAQDHIYAPQVRQLRLLGIPTWLLTPGRFVAAELYSASSAVTSIGPRRPT